MGKNNKKSGGGGGDNRSRKSKSKKAPAKKSGSGGGGGGDKAFFRVDDGRAMKAKKNKAFVKFNKVCWFILDVSSILTSSTVSFHCRPK